MKFYEFYLELISIPFLVETYKLKSGHQPCSTGDSNPLISGWWRLNISILECCKGLRNQLNTLHPMWRITDEYIFYNVRIYRSHSPKCYWQHHLTFYIWHLGACLHVWASHFAATHCTCTFFKTTEHALYLADCADFQCSSYSSSIIWREWLCRDTLVATIILRKVKQLFPSFILTYCNNFPFFMKCNMSAFNYWHLTKK
jgi:hypothetical protein